MEISACEPPTDATLDPATLDADFYIPATIGTLRPPLAKNIRPHTHANLITRVPTTYFVARGSLTGA